MTEKIPKQTSTKYMPIIEDITKALQEYKKSLSYIKHWGHMTRITYSDSDYPICVIYATNAQFGNFKIPKGSIEEIDIMILIEHKSFKDDKVELLYAMLEDIECVLTDKIDFNSSPKYKVKEFLPVGWELQPNTDGSFIFETLMIQAKMKVIMCPTCKEESE